MEEVLINWILGYLYIHIFIYINSLIIYHYISTYYHIYIYDIYIIIYHYKYIHIALSIFTTSKSKTYLTPGEAARRDSAQGRGSSARAGRVGAPAVEDLGKR